MPSIIATPRDLWIRDNPCPESGGGVHLWIIRAGRALEQRGVPMELARDFIGTALTRGESPAGEIQQALIKVYSSPCGASGIAPRVPIPAYDPDRLLRIASRVPFEVTDDWLAEVSPECV